MKGLGCQGKEVNKICQEAIMKAKAAKELQQTLKNVANYAKKKKWLRGGASQNQTKDREGRNLRK